MAWITSPPDRLETDRFIIRPLTPEDCDLDYEAVMDSQAQLLQRSQGKWPISGFSWQDNLGDLNMHYAEHQQREAFTYTVLARDEKHCLGCVYVKPLRDSLVAAGLAEEAADTSPNAAKVSFWARSGERIYLSDVALFKALKGWFHDVWPFAQVLVEASSWDLTMIKLLHSQAGRVVIELNYSDLPDPYLFFDLGNKRHG